MDNDNPGYRVMAGGVDGVAVTLPQQDPGITWTLSWTRLSQGAAAHVVAQELESGEGGPVFGDLGLEERPGDALFTATLESLIWRLMATRAEPIQVEELEQLWQSIDALEGPAIAWASLVSVLLRDPDFIGY